MPLDNLALDPVAFPAVTSAAHGTPACCGGAGGLGVAVRPHDAPPLRSTRARGRRWPTSTATPPVLVACRQPWLPNTSHARTCAGAKTRGLDSVFALCRTLSLFCFSRGVVGRAVVWVEKSPRATLAA